MVKGRVIALNRVALGLIVCVIALGAFTRLVDAGLGCPDWPGCYGHVLWPTEASEIAAAEQAYPETPVDQDKTWPEMVHRYFAGALLVLVATLTFTIWRVDPVSNLRVISASLLVLITCQAAFGAWTVTLKLWPQVVTAHLLGGFATFSLLWLMYMKQGGAPGLRLKLQDKQTLRLHARVALVVVVLQIAIGGWVSSNYAALACADFPTCFGSYAPQMDLAQGFNIFQAIGPNYLGGLLDSDSRVAIHWFHRIGALVVMVVVGALVFRLWARQVRLASMVGAILIVQIILGSLNVVWSLPLSVATAHNGVGALLLLTMVTVNFAPPEDAA